MYSLCGISPTVYSGRSMYSLCGISPTVYSGTISSSGYTVAALDGKYWTTLSPTVEEGLYSATGGGVGLGGGAGMYSTGAGRASATGAMLYSGAGVGAGYWMA